MLSTVYKETVSGILVYLPDTLMQMGIEISEEELPQVCPKGQENHSCCISLLAKKGLPAQQLYVIARFIQRSYPENKIDWRATFYYLSTVQVQNEQYSKYDREKRFDSLMNTDAGWISRDIEVQNRIASLNLIPEALHKADINLALFNLS